MSLALAASIAAAATFSAAMAYSALKDVLTMQVSDRVVLLLLGTFPLFALLSGWSLPEVLTSLGIAALAFAICFAFFAMGWMGGGDGKLITATILWMGAGHAVEFLLYTALIGGLFALVLRVFRALPLPYYWQQAAWLAHLHRPQTGIPYAVAIGMAALILLPQTPWLAGSVL